MTPPRAQAFLYGCRAEIHPEHVPTDRNGRAREEEPKLPALIVAGLAFGSIPDVR